MPDPGQDHRKRADSDHATVQVVDSAVSRAYRQLARESAPAALDERIRARARGPAPARRWQRPLAVAAILALALSLAMQVGQPPDDGRPFSAPESGSSGGGGALLLPEDKILPSYVLQPDSSDAGRAVSELGEASRRAAQSLAVSDASPTSARCREHVDDADAWLACIEDLESAGEVDAAERERKAWAARHRPEASPAD